jgi:hypothetical protein
MLGTFLTNVAGSLSDILGQLGTLLNGVLLRTSYPATSLGTGPDVLIARPGPAVSEPACRGRPVV